MTRRRLRSLVCAGLALATAALATVAVAEPISVRHAQGQTVLPGVPDKVVVTDWAAFDNLDALGVPVAGVPGSATPPYLGARIGADVPRVGSLQEPDVEAIAAEAPDLVIVASRSRTALPTLSQVAPTIDMTVDNADLVGGVRANLLEYGRIFGREARAGELVAALDARIAEARAALAGKGTGLVLVVNGGRLGVYGPGSRTAWIFDALGVPPASGAADSRDHGGDAVSFEYLVERNPDWLFVVDRDAGIGNAGTAHQVLDNELVRGTRFWREKRIVYLDPAAAYVTMHGVSGLMLMLDQIVARAQDAS
ncbi:siderophore ABC transporter substrate-binding protein (plasmid) [Aureimonas ureilytica]|uniref:siderophore ABC transporter substrate-binding protein n=1 Tax=Aureimonas ureilytica TaxID=401562 RepID=UPI003CFAC4C0